MNANVKDRTNEFTATVESLYNRGAAGIVGVSGVDPLLGSTTRMSKSPKQEHGEFTRKATEINNGIQRVLQKLEKLTKLTKSRTVFDDRPVEVQELAQIIKGELAKLNGQISDLQNYQKIRKSGSYHLSGPSNKSAEEHSSQIVVSLQSRLAEVSSSFTTVLEVRSQGLKAQKDRRDQFSATNIMPVASPISRQRTTVTGRSSPTKPDDHFSIDMSSGGRGEGGGPSLQQLQLLTSNTSDTAYLESRSAALQGIEATINELGTIYQQLASMISEQGEVVQRIDMNIEEMQFNIEKGQNELMKYLRNMSSNRWLMIKIFAILIVFIVFWSIFLL